MGFYATNRSHLDAYRLRALGEAKQFSCSANFCKKMAQKVSLVVTQLWNSWLIPTINTSIIYLSITVFKKPPNSPHFLIFFQSQPILAHRIHHNHTHIQQFFIYNILFNHTHYQVHQKTQQDSKTTRKLSNFFGAVITNLINSFPTRGSLPLGVVTNPAHPITEIKHTQKLAI